MSELKKIIRSFYFNFFSFETNYFTIGGFKKTFSFFLKSGHLVSHSIDRVRFYIYPKFGIAASFPTHLEIEVASKCQMKCPMCWTTYLNENIKGIMKFDLYKKIIDEAAKNKIFSIKLSWRGEPLLNPKIVEMIKYAKDKNIKDVAFLTNAELLTKKMADKLIDSGLDWISVSADGVDEVYNQIRFPALFEETVERVKYLKSARDLRGLTKPLIRVQSIMSAVENNTDKFYESWKDVSDKVNIIADQIRSYEIDPQELEFDHYFICGKPFQRLAIGHDGRVHQCIADYEGKNILGDINNETILQVWNGKKNKQLRESFLKHTYYKVNEACKQCSYGLAQEQSKLSISSKEKLKVNVYKSVPPVVSQDGLSVETPLDKIPNNQREKYKEALRKKDELFAFAKKK